jgi:chromosome segregation ATPase
MCAFQALDGLKADLASSTATSAAALQQAQLELDALQSDKGKTAEDAARLTAELAAASGEGRRLAGEVAQFKVDLAKCADERAALEAQAAKAASDLAKLRVEEGKAAAEATKVAAARDTAMKEVVDLKDQLVAVRTELAAVQADLVKSKAQLEETLASACVAWCFVVCGPRVQLCMCAACGVWMPLSTGWFVSCVVCRLL